MDTYALENPGTRFRLERDSTMEMGHVRTFDDVEELKKTEITIKVLHFSPSQVVQKLTGLSISLIIKEY